MEPRTTGSSSLCCGLWTMMQVVVVVALMAATSTTAFVLDPSSSHSLLTPTTTSSSSSTTITITSSSSLFSPCPSLSSFTARKMVAATTPPPTVAADAAAPPPSPASIPFKPRKTREERLEAASKGLQVHVMGLSIHHAQVHVRERLAVPESAWNAVATALCECSAGLIVEAAVLSTCNRFEVYYATSDARAATAALTYFLAQRSGLPVAVLRPNLFLLSGADAVWHIMRVSGGLDSLIVGEGQILSQVRQCYLHSVEDNGKGGKVLARLLNSAVAAGKRVRSETAISKGSVSISSAAVELSEMLSPTDLQLPFAEARLAVVGAGKMTRLLVTHLASRGLQAITIVNRSMPRLIELQEQFPDVDIQVKLMDDLWDVVGRSDIVYTATSCVDYVIDEQKLEENGLASGRPLMLVDISVPRNVGENCKQLSHVFAYNVDDLKAVVAKNTAMRQREMKEAEALLRDETDAFCTWRESLGAIPTINQLQERANTFREEELKKCTRKLSQANLSDKEMEAVERLSRGIVNKLLHGPMSHLRRSEGIEGKQAALKELNAMFRLVDDDTDSTGRNGRKSINSSSSSTTRSSSSRNARQSRR